MESTPGRCPRCPAPTLPAGRSASNVSPLHLFSVELPAWRFSSLPQPGSSIPRKLEPVVGDSQSLGGGVGGDPGLDVRPSNPQERCGLDIAFYGRGLIPGAGVRLLNTAGRDAGPSTAKGRWRS